MNLVAHAETAFRFKSDNIINQTEFALGAALIDLIGMSGSKRSPRAFAGRGRDLHRGMRFHYRTDSVFHELPIFTELESQASSELMNIVTRDHVANGWAEIGTEMLLDGVLLENRQVASHFAEILDYGRRTTKIQKALGGVARSGKDFVAFFEDYAAAGVPTYYQNSETVVAALRRRIENRDKHRLKKRPAHLIISDSQAKAIEAVFVCQQERLRGCGYEIIEQTLATLRKPEPKVVKLDSVDPEEVRKALGLRQGPGDRQGQKTLNLLGGVRMHISDNRRPKD